MEDSVWLLLFKSARNGSSFSLPWRRFWLMTSGVRVVVSVLGGG